MGRAKLPRLAAVPGGLSQENLSVLERAASILNRPISDLLPTSGQYPNSGPHRQPAQQQSVTEAGPEDLDGTGSRPEDQTSSLEDSDSREDSDGVAEWQTSAAEFRNIDDDIGETYIDLDPWYQDSSHQAPDSAQVLAASGTSTELYEIVDHPQPPSRPRPGVPLTPPDDISARAYQRLSWELVNTTVAEPMAFQSARDPSGWVVTGSQNGVHRQPRLAYGAGNADALQIIPVDPLQQQSRPRRRGAYDDRKRQEDTGKTRGLKACVRCRMQKIRCVPLEDDPKGVCGTCQALSGQKVHHLPCLRHRLTESTLYRTGKGPGLEFTFRWPVMKLKDIDEWASPEVRTISVMSDVCPKPLQLAVRKFVPIPNKDSIHRSWMDQKKVTKKRIETTPYAIVDMHKAAKDMREYIDANVFSCMDFFLEDSDDLVKETYQFARRYMQRTESNEEKNLLCAYFRLWFAVRRTATMEHIVGNEVLDMVPETEDTTCPFYKKIPLPPVMIQQLDMILTLGVLQPAQKQFLEDFQKVVLANNPNNWMTVYLITFMSLHSCAKITAENYSNARKHGLLRRYSIPNFIQERHHTANVFLSHYHYRTESANPFIQDWRRRHATPFAHMSVHDIQFLNRTKMLVKEREPTITTNKELHLYEHELYFIAQMFEENWQPRDTIIDFDDGTVNNVGLKKFAAQ